jgi:hypothetical protein
MSPSRCPAAQCKATPWKKSILDPTAESTNVSPMSAVVQHIAEELKELSTQELRAVQALVADMVAEVAPTPEQFGSPITDDDIAEAARVTFSYLDADESKP